MAKPLILIPLSYSHQCHQNNCHFQLTLTKPTLLFGGYKFPDTTHRKGFLSLQSLNHGSLTTISSYLMQPTKVGVPSRTIVQLRSFQSVSKAFGLEPVGARLTCSLQTDLKDLAQKCVDATKIAGFALATSALVVLGASAEGVPKRLTYDEIQSKTYMEVKGTGTANQCPTIDGGVDSFAFKPGKYYAKKLYLEPTSFTVKAEGVSKNAPPEFQKTKLMTRLTYTLDEIEGPFEVSTDGTVKFEEKDGIDYAAVTVQLPGGERVPFLFSIKQLVASGKPESFGGDFLVPSYRGSSFLDPKGRGGSTGYDNAVALPAGGRGDEEEQEYCIFFRENHLECYQDQDQA
ncbi:hypothetical protein CRYUN_Cryun24cG0021100 [Craigia yunnanensis]